MGQKPTTVTGLGNAIKELETRGAAVESKMHEFETNFKELTGKHPREPVNALDVVKICYRLYGEPGGSKIDIVRP